MKVRPNTQRFDPYKNARFRIRFGRKTVAGVDKITGLPSKARQAKHREGGDPSSAHKSPGRTKYDSITLERGVTHDPEFQQWANQTRKRRDVTIELLNEAGKKLRSYKLCRCRVSQFQALPDLDANANAVAIQHMKLEYEGWKRDE